MLMAVETDDVTQRPRTGKGSDVNTAAVILLGRHTHCAAPGLTNLPCSFAITLL